MNDKETVKSNIFQLKEKDVKEFQVLYKKHYNEDLSMDHAAMLADHLIKFMSFILVEK